MTECQQRFLEALQAAVNSGIVETRADALHYMVGRLMVEHAHSPAVDDALNALRMKERAARAA